MTTELLGIDIKRWLHSFELKVYFRLRSLLKDSESAGKKERTQAFATVTVTWIEVYQL